MKSKNKSRTEIVIEAMGNDETTSSDLSKITGLSSQSVGAILRNSRNKGLVILVGEKTVGKGNNWHKVSVWRKINKPVVIIKNRERNDEIEIKKPMNGITSEDLKWMNYWKNRRIQRLNRIYGD